MRPGPVADRLLGERADGRVDYLLAAAVKAEEEAAAADGATRRRRIAGGETSGRRLPAGGTAPDLLSEIREGLKLYRYSGEGYDRSIVRDGGGGVDDPRINDNKHKLSQISNVKMIGNMKSMVDGKSCLEKNDYTPLTCKNCCELATRLLENLEEKTRLCHQQSTISTYPEKPFSDSKSTSHYHDDSNCYCSLPTNNDRRIKNVAAIAVGKSNNTVSISNCLECTKSSKCCVCSASDYS
ncbi:hypothetical protein AGLY_013867 [Aphis glycines]|uniref:Uncharacterized protein n=1 Tax=Aphis glycines TaxID=307491 RepID=A0A6G0T5Y4_APHGL|nr:hypothetical protein AGLY_013867 [Aphis glycines]